MDVPTWHPANEDSQAPHAALESTTGSKPVATKTEFKLMPGSDIDTSTEAGRELLYDVQDSMSLGAGTGHPAVDGRGFFDASDRSKQNVIRLSRKKVSLDANRS
uniref:AlNc14C54G4156 protein n=1 Tax=Albugo laibachii Nc14 TaxID=890382 RepID=F0WBW8_9STRA|nr:AlNc14C54G4156 [Albugo laibachii Nc14]|eukprot:CCA18647.1 AlNc14C54G4156 [Albugo laibachii Nc14]